LTHVEVIDSPLAAANKENSMTISSFIKKQFIDVLEWTESIDGVLAWRFPMQDMEIQNGAVLVVRESQVAVFVDEGKVADVFTSGTYKLTTKTIPLLTNIKNWDKLFASPFKSDVYFFSTRQQVDQKWGTQEPITLRDRDFGLVRVRAFGNFSYRVIDPVCFMREISGTREIYRSEDIQNQLRGLVLQHISTAIGMCKIPFVDLASNQNTLSDALRLELAEKFMSLGLEIEQVTVQNLSLPAELQRILDQKIGMNMVGGDMNDLIRFQAAQAIPTIAESMASTSNGGSSMVGDAFGIGVGLAFSQMASKNFIIHDGAATTTDDLFVILEKLGQLKERGLLTEDEFASKKADLLNRIK
jgi:membrane protease subunit (stomatin/prohibitin family)